MQSFGLGDYFTSCLRADIEGLKITAGIHPIIYQDYHRCLSRTFPYGIFYSHDKKIVTIWAVLDLRRDPQWIAARLVK